MADTKISALAAVASIDGTQEHAVNESGTTKKATGTQQAEYTESRLQNGVLCSHATDQTLTTGTWTTLAFDTEAFKVGDSAIHSTSTNNSRITAQITGEYILVALVRYDAAAADFIVGSRFYKNGSTQQWIETKPSTNDATYGSYGQMTAMLQLTAADYVELQAFHTRGSDLDVLSAATRFGVYLLGR